MKTTRPTTEVQSTPGSFADKVGVELNRAERYRVFVSLTVIDLEPARQAAGDRAEEIVPDLISRVKDSVRACDHVELIEGHCLAVLLPETPRQGAEIMARRLAETIRGGVSESTGKSLENVIPIEIASYPDTAGARTMASFLEELVHKSRN